MDNNLLMSQDGAVRVLTLNRPDKLNAFDEALSTAVQSALKKIQKDDDVRAVVITGAGRGFCSGEDLQSVCAESASGSMLSSKSMQECSLGNTVRRKYIPTISALRRIEKPFIAAINGVAAGAGMGLALACDFRIAATEATFVQAFSKIGLVPDSGCTLLARLISNPTRAFDLMLSGDKLNAAEALQLGLLNKVVAQEEVLVSAMALAQQLASGPTRAYALTKRAFNLVMFPDLEQILEHEAKFQDMAGRTQDYREGVKAFIEKRKATYKGR